MADHLPDFEALAVTAGSYAAWAEQVEAFVDTVEVRVVKTFRSTVQVSRRAYERNDWTPTTERAEWTVHVFVDGFDLSGEYERVRHDGTSEVPWLLLVAAEYADQGKHPTRKAATALVEATRAAFHRTLVDKWNYYNALDANAHANA